MERLQHITVDHSLAPVADIVAALEHTVNDFTDSSARFDDITIVVAKCLK
jgi:serine phosphatase RsbU (regulator of sigma subunit)